MADFPTLDTDMDPGRAESRGAAKRVCIATSDILGPIKNGGIGTAYHHVATLLAARGHEVVVAYVNANAADEELMAPAAAFYGELGVTFEPVVPSVTAATELAKVPASTWTLLEWLRARERAFDIVHVSEWRGLGYGPLLAKSLGLAFGETHFVVKGSSPTLWQAEGNRHFLTREQQLGWVFMERRSVELADTVICGSAHLLGWMRDAGYALPSRSFVWPNAFPAPDDSQRARSERASRDGVELEEVVFFGRLEPRKGLLLFIDALERLVRRGRAPGRVTFLGGVSPRIDGPGLIREASRGWPVEVKTLTGYGSREAVSYLSRPGRLAVIPSLLENSSMAVMECLQAGIPFVAASTGGTPELVAEADRGRALVEADHIALGERIAELSAGRLRAVRARWDFAGSLEVWSRWHGQSGAFEASAARHAARRRRVAGRSPLVTVCIVHHERPGLVRMAVDSVYGQDYGSLEAVLVDDGSEGSEAVAAVEEIEGEFAGRGWRVVRQENRYLGAARNAAASAARGEWLLFLDDDNVLYPDAVRRLVEAALFSGADCVPGASVRFFGEGDPRADGQSHGTPIRFIGAARGWSRFRNVVGDACALVCREVYEAVGGFTEAYRVGLDDLTFFNRLMESGYRIEPLPDPVYWYRIGERSMKSRNRSAEAAQLRVLGPHLSGLPADERAWAVHVAGKRLAAERDGHYFRGELAMRRGDWDSACGHWGEIRRLFADEPSGYLRGAAALLEAGRLEECEAVANEGVARCPDRHEGYYYRAEAAMRRQDWRRACERWGEMRRLFVDESSGYVRGAAALLAAGRLPECEAVANEGVARFPDRSESHYHRAEAEMRRRDWSGACEHWGEMRRLFPDDSSGYLRGAAALLEAGRLEECEAVANEGIERFPDRHESHYLRAEAATRRRDWSGACGHWSEIRRLFPDDSSGYLRGAAALLEAGRLEECEAVAVDASHRFPGRWESFYHRAEAAMRRRDWGAACERWFELRRLFPAGASDIVRGAAMLRRVRWSGPWGLGIDVLAGGEREGQARRREEGELTLEVRRNGRALGRVSVGGAGEAVRFATGLKLPVVAGEALYSIHDASTGEVLAAVCARGWWRARRVRGAVEDRPGPEIRGWLLDAGAPQRRGRVAIHVGGRLRAVVEAGELRGDIARWKGTEGRHGFLWRIPEAEAGVEGLRIDVVDADTGRSLRGSPVRVEGGGVVASRRRGR